MFNVIQKIQSNIDDVVKYILEDDIFGKNEVSVIRKNTKDVIVLPSQTNCKMGCKFCHLTGTTRPANNFTTEWFIEIVKFIIRIENLTIKPILISFMGAGEPLLNSKNILEAIDELHEDVPEIRFALATMIPNHKLFDDIVHWMKSKPSISLKIHLSLHGMFSRREIIDHHISAWDAIARLQEYNDETNNPIEYHYALVDGINDSIEELTEFRDWIIPYTDIGLKTTTVKFLTLSEVNGFKKTRRTKEEILNLFKNVIVEFYDPPGRDIGSSCGMFDRSIYMKKEDKDGKN